MQTNSYHIFQKKLGIRIQAIRKQRGLTQEAVGNLLDMDRVSIGYIEQGKRTPKLSTLHSMAELYGIDIKAFFEFSEPD